MKPIRHACRVLVVDGQPLLRDGLRAALQRVLPKAIFEEAGSAAEAWEKWGLHSFRLVLLDVNLPDAKGLELTRRIHAADPQAILLVLSADTGPWAVRTALAAGASGYVSKTRSARCVGQAVLTVLQGRQFLCEDSQAALSSGDSPGEPPGPAVLSERERQVLRLFAQGENTKNVAGLLGISPKTVETHRQHLRRKLRLHNLAALTRYAVRQGLIPA